MCIRDRIKGTFAKFMTFGSGKSDAVMADNAEWLTTLNYIEMLRDVGRHFSINRMLTVYDYWQFWRNTEDGDVARFLKLFTTLPLDEIGRLAALQGQEINEAKKVLATEATALLHGRAAADQAADTARTTFEQGAVAENLPTVEVPRAELEAGLGVLTVFAEKTGLVASNGEARRQIKGGGLKVNDAAVADEKMTLSAKDLTAEGVIK